MCRAAHGPERVTKKFIGRLNVGEFGAATQAHSLATTMGINSDTEIAGPTLGGGFGRLARKHGLACDNLIEAEMVLAVAGP